MSKDIFARIREKEASLSRGQKGIARYIQENQESAAFMTAARISKAVGVSESTVVRFAAELGYSGYPELQGALRRRVLQKLSAEEAQGADGISAAFACGLAQLTKARDTLDRGRLMAAAEAVARAGKVYLYADHRADFLCRRFYTALLPLRSGVQFLGCMEQQELCLALLDRADGDVFLEINLPGSWEQRARLLARRMGLMTISFGWDGEETADYSFPCTRSSLPSELFPMSLLALLQAFLGALGDVQVSIREDREQRMAEFYNREEVPE